MYLSLNRLSQDRSSFSWLGFPGFYDGICDPCFQAIDQAGDFPFLEVFRALCEGWGLFETLLRLWIGGDNFRNRLVSKIAKLVTAHCTGWQKALDIVLLSPCLPC
jgi:hypothetical protein